MHGSDPPGRFRVASCRLHLMPAAPGLLFSADLDSAVLPG